MSLECHDTWCHLLTSCLVEKDVKILWECHDILMQFDRIFIRKRHPRKMPWECHSMGLKISVNFDGIFMEKLYRIVMELDVIFDQNSDENQWWHFIMRVICIFDVYYLLESRKHVLLRITEYFTCLIVLTYAPREK